ncbi:hypothetical protein P171DRAFT_515683 [Karstenula rhodostoma CBS 690.94]|uniref:Uncharacterized protein n=1 Tax=Karstenula rhodostoma CBS 690.94 TaxID=1392251 RepID=A0A9P4PZH0_9PLEO|nr:hypothetical protein P171DRAFT_515683 [Karstenula rhodostoma CBS 690.94]
MTVELPYTLHTRYASIATAWSVILTPPIFLNLSLFYGLWYGKPDLDRILVLTLPTAILGLFTALATLDRVWKLTQPTPLYRPLHAPRPALDIFQWGYFAVLAAISALITAALARNDADHDFQIRLLSLPTALLMSLVATLTLISLVLNVSGWRLPFRFGSVPAGNVLRPAVYYIVEDVVAVDGGGGVEYREAFCKRYESSAVFRRMMFELSVVWMLWFYVFAGVFAALVFRLPVAAVYAVGWAGPFPLVGGVAVWTVFYVRARLREEREGVVEGERAPLLG